MDGYSYTPTQYRWVGSTWVGLDDFSFFECCGQILARNETLADDVTERLWAKLNIMGPKACPEFLSFFGLTDWFRQKSSKELKSVLSEKTPRPSCRLTESRGGESTEKVQTRPDYYKVQIGGVWIEALDLIEALGLDFSLGNCVKYIWRGGKKSPDLLSDLKKAKVYLERKIARLEEEEKSDT
jgi:hypothetical protein